MSMNIECNVYIVNICRQIATLYVESLQIPTLLLIICGIVLGKFPTNLKINTSSNANKIKKKKKKIWRGKYKAQTNENLLGLTTWQDLVVNARCGWLLNKAHVRVSTFSFGSTPPTLDQRCTRFPFWLVHTRTRCFRPPRRWIASDRCLANHPHLGRIHTFRFTPTTRPPASRNPWKRHARFHSCFRAAVLLNYVLFRNVEETGMKK